MRLKPLNDLILFTPDPVADYLDQGRFTELKKRGAALPDKYRVGPTDPPITGTVLSKGKLCKEPLIRRGSKIVVGKFSVARFETDGKQQMLVREYDVMALLNGH